MFSEAWGLCGSGIFSGSLSSRAAGESIFSGPYCRPSEMNPNIEWAKDKSCSPILLPASSDRQHTISNKKTILYNFPLEKNQHLDFLV